jgi:hypothetical protein
MPKLDSFCGIYCGACLCNIVKAEGNIAEVAQKLGKTIEQLTCSECKTALHQDCCFVTCCTAKGFSNCAACPDMPCDEINKFANDGLKHHATIITNLLRIREIGLANWLNEQKARYTCPDCGTRTGWLYQTCANCSCELSK